VLFVIFALTWTAVYLKRKNSDDPITKKRAKDLFTVSVVVSVVLIHPTVTRQIFSLFSCTHIPRKGWFLAASLNEECYTYTHWVWMLAFGVPLIVIYACGGPVLCVWLLFKRKHKLWTDSATRQKYGFLFLGYEERAYWWECVVMGRKVGMVMVSVFFRGFGTAVQVSERMSGDLLSANRASTSYCVCQTLVAILVLTACLCLHLAKRPYDAPILHRLDVRGRRQRVCE
jgi:hypothetical protein